MLMLIHFNYVFITQPNHKTIQLGFIYLAHLLYPRVLTTIFKTPKKSLKVKCSS